MVEESAELQKRLLDAAAPMTKPGGVLVYSVCSFEPEEAEQVVSWFLETHPEYALDPIDGVVPPDVVVDHMMRVLPSQFGTDGAFAARFRRSA